MKICVRNAKKICHRLAVKNANSVGQVKIDVIAKKSQEIVFIEVKTRSSLDFGKPSEAVNSIKLKHMYKTAQYFLYKSHSINNFIRFDVIEVLVEDGKFNVNHIKQKI